MQDLLLYALGLARPKKKDGLASKTHVDLYDYGLSGLEGAKVVLQQIELTPHVTHINLGHNPLGYIGLSTIIDYLCLEEDSFPIEELNLNDCDIGDSGLGTISRYIKHNRTLRRLYLAGNKISGWGPSVGAFADALNHSRVQTLVLTNNEGLSDRFLFRFLRKLDAPYLREIQLSKIGLTQASLPTIDRFLTSLACYGLRSLHINANSLSNKGLKDLVGSLLTSNTTLCGMEAFANSLPESLVYDGKEVMSDEALLETTLQALSLVLVRNTGNLEKVTYEAKALLVVARTLLLTQERHELPNGASEMSFPWQKLAPELQYHVLRFLHNTLSDAQHARICSYASKKATLPPFSPFSELAKSKQDYVEDYLIAVGCNRFEGILTR